MQRPRTLISLALGLSLVALSPAPNAGADESMSGSEMFADASWMFPKAKPGTFTGYLAFAIDHEPSSGPDVLSMAIVMSGPCRRNGDTTTCRGKHGGIFDLKPGQLQVASDWSSARLAVGKRKERVTLTWTAEGLPLPQWTGTAGAGWSSNGDEYEYETEGIGISRQAQVEGTMFGRTLGADGLEQPATFYRGEYRGTYRSGDRFLTIGSVRWRLPA